MIVGNAAAPATAIDCLRNSRRELGHTGVSSSWHESTKGFLDFGSSSAYKPWAQEISATVLASWYCGPPKPFQS